MKKTIRPFFLIFAKKSNLKNKHVTVNKEFWQLFCKFQDLFSQSQEGDRTRVSKKRISSRCKKFLAHFFTLLTIKDIE